VTIVAKKSHPKQAKPTARRKRTRGLLLVGLFKLSKVLFFGLVGIGAMRLLHRNVGDLVMRITDALPLDPEGHFVSLVMDRADLIGNHQLRMVGLGALVYAVVCLVEGVGLLMEKVWAEYLTLVLTTLALPWEIFELCKQPSLYKGGLIAANVLVVLYLIWIVRRNVRKLKSE
jgi:uncharacterized membrane protein (DUF2068 family)